MGTAACGMCVLATAEGAHLRLQSLLVFSLLMGLCSLLLGLCLCLLLTTVLLQLHLLILLLLPPLRCLLGPILRLTALCLVLAGLKVQLTLVLSLHSACFALPPCDSPHFASSAASRCARLGWPGIMLLRVGIQAADLSLCAA